MENRISHHGIVSTVEKNLVSVTMQVEDACNTCEGHNDCRFANSTTKMVEIKTSQWEDYKVGEQVMVNITPRQSTFAILLAYLFPALLIIAVVIILNFYGLNEMLIALIAILSIGLYTAMLYLLRKKLDHKFSFTLSKLEEN